MEALIFTYLAAFLLLFYVGLLIIGASCTAVLLGVQLFRKIKGNVYRQDYTKHLK
ncbi:hypothetical protein [Bacillus sp. V59.32b]|uniref:hypothetical protein n=1 Tax=Bacillus sp. V59.32b TaxID=1758642 RepID=UPI001359BD8F|nr:hypothetical protein [Bacillus sp. V59.32b]